MTSRPAAALLVLALVSAGAAGAASHPRLVDVATARCTDCHDDLWPAGAALHAPVEDACTACHQLTVAESGTEVRLTAAGTDLCLTCHHELAAAVEADLASAHAPVANDCSTCHDPHASRHPPLLASPVAELCNRCHVAGDLKAAHGGQLTNRTDCRSCHDPHGSANPGMLLAGELHAPFSEGSCKGCHRQPFAERIRLRSRGEKLCVSCHGDLAFDRSGDDGTVHAAMRGERSRAGCLSCHDPHMSPHRRLLVAPGSELCNRCHQEVVTAATAETGHAAAAEDCLHCHRPHVAAERPLLSAPAQEHCVRCHDTVDEELSAAHLGADLESLACVSCHDPHGSGHDHLLARHLHGALEAGCDRCHDGAADRFLEAGSELCLSCHDDVGEAAAAAAVPHAAIEAGVCTQCHNPHASAQEKLIKLPAGGTCAECHDEQAAGDGEVAHGVIGLLGCRACHQPHGGSRRALLRREGAELCLSCHEKKRLDIGEGAASVELLGFEVPVTKVAAMATVPLSADGERGHPVDNHRALGVPTEEELKITDTTYRGELGCLTCHDPHKGRSRKLLNWGAASALEACIECHPK